MGKKEPSNLMKASRWKIAGGAPAPEVKINCPACGGALEKRQDTGIGIKHCMECKRGWYIVQVTKEQGGVPERTKGADCKSAGDAFAGSNPAPTISVEVNE